MIFVGVYNESRIGVQNNTGPHWLSLYRKKTLFQSIFFCVLQNKEGFG